jgi:hypothetical protein
MRRSGLAVDTLAALGPEPHPVVTPRFYGGMNVPAPVRACSHGETSAIAARLE